MKVSDFKGRGQLLYHIADIEVRHHRGGKDRYQSTPGRYVPRSVTVGLIKEGLATSWY